MQETREGYDRFLVVIGAIKMVLMCDSFRWEKSPNKDGSSEFRIRGWIKSFEESIEFFNYHSHSSSFHRFFAASSCNIIWSSLFSPIFRKLLPIPLADSARGLL